MSFLFGSLLKGKEVPAMPIPPGYHFEAGKGIVADNDPNQHLNIDDWKKYADSQTPTGKIMHWLPYVVVGVAAIYVIKRL